MIIDNKLDHYPEDGINIITVWDFISKFSGKESGQTGHLDIVTGYFTIFTLSKLYEEMPSSNHYRIISSEMVGDDYKKDVIVDLLSNDMDICNLGNLDKHARQAIAFLERDTVEMRAEMPDFCHAKTYIFKNNNPVSQNYYITGSSNLTPAGIGLKQVPNVELNLAQYCLSNQTDYCELRNWFNGIWDKARKEIPEDRDNKKSPKIPVKEYFIRKIKEYFRTYTPEEIYYKILYELFNSDLKLDGSIEHTRDMSLLQTSVIWNTLFKYQQKGVISLIKMLRKHNGAILADAVGLGKTFSALAVIKYFQIQNYTTVLLCPKKLEYNWKQYIYGSGSRFDKDELKYEVRFHSDLQNDRLQAAYDTFKLDYLQSRKKILIVIDESHNLRNEKSTRYTELLHKLVENQDGLKERNVKVLMLSATPINTGIKDVKGQFRLIAQGKDDAFNTPDFGVDSLENVFKDAQAKYTKWAEEENRTIGGFIKMLPQKFFNLTDQLIVARTRKLIEKTLGEDLGFPQKKSPVNIYQGVEHFGEYSSTDEIYNAFDSLALTAYQPSSYLHKSKEEALREAKEDWGNDVNREMFLVKMMCILFMKRLESSWFALQSTIKKVLDVHENTLAKVNNYITTGVDEIIRTGEEIYDEEDEQEQFVHRRQIKVSDIKNLDGFKKGLEYDVEILNKIYNSLCSFESDYRNKKEKDLKLDKLEEIIREKGKTSNKKVVIFTAYADTAYYLYEELRNRGFSRIAAVSGQDRFSSGGHSKSNFTEILQSFAPYSKLYKELDWDNLYSKTLDRAKYYNDEKQRWEVPYETWKELVKKHNSKRWQLLTDEIDILIATDCLSEGQNLQDADMQINYDIHWNPVRLIQRFGRIDRIGSPNKFISCVNFWPAKSFEEYLNLEGRIQGRMLMMNLVGSETIDINDAYIKMIDDNPLFDKNAARLLRELSENSISDIESPRTLSLKDFSFESYRQDLEEYYGKNQEFYRRMPNGVFSGFINQSPNHKDLPDSLIALVGYPKKPEGKKAHTYSELYIMCQPIDSQPYWQEINKADVLELLRQNKNARRSVPGWILENDTERINKLSGVLKEWMQQKAPAQAVVNIKNLLGKKKINIVANPEKKQQLLEDKFKIENFDLIVWEYMTENKNL